MISIIVPVLNEAKQMEGCLSRLEQQDKEREIIVVDGGSQDGTLQCVCGEARTLSTRRGRAVQMNAGARLARGKTLLFLHVDTELGPDALAGVTRALEDPAVVGGGFLKRYDARHPLLGALAWTINQLRSRGLRQLVGTQAIFVRRPVFEELGGFLELPLLEDVEFCDRLGQAGKLAVIGPPVLVSARRYEARGVLRQIVVNALVLSLYRLGVAPERLLRLYRGAGA